MMVVRPGQGRVPYVPFERRTPAYSGKIVVAREDGIVEKHSQGSFIKLLCKETTGDEGFTLGERTYDPCTSLPLMPMARSWGGGPRSEAWATEWYATVAPWNATYPK